MEDSIIDREREKVSSQHHNKDHHSNYKYTPPPPDTSNVSLSDFINPRSMLTPGIAGSMVMLIANTLWVQFMLPQKYSALALSFLLIIPILIKFSCSILENLIYFIFNGLIVFALSVNTNFVGSKLQEISGVVVQASLDSQKITDALKNLASTKNVNDEVKKINYTQLAANDHQQLPGSKLLADNNDNDDSSKQEDKKKKKKSKDENDKDNRKFFQPWF